MHEDLVKKLKGDVDRRTFLKACGIVGAGAVVGGVLQGAFGVLRIDSRRVQVDRTLLRMGSFVTITAVHDSRDQAEEGITAAIVEMDRLIRILSRHDASSPLATLNRTGELRGAPAELAVVLREALDVTRASKGAFDVTVQPVLALFERGGEMPRDDEVREALAHVGSRHVIMSGGDVHLDDPLARITLDGIAPGFIVDRISDVLVRHGVESHLVNVSGDIRVRGRRSDGKPWHIAVQDPERNARYPAVIELGAGAVSTSGSYEIYYDRRRIHHHIIDPSTGVSPADAISVSVVAPTSMRADALSTATFVMAAAKGTQWIDTVPGAECLVIDPAGDAHRSAGWDMFAVKT